MKHKVITTPKAPAAKGHYSHAIATNDTVYISGQLGLGLNGNMVGDDFETQVKQALHNLHMILHAAECNKANIVFVTVLLNDIKDGAAFNTIYTEFMQNGELKPARAMYEVANLPLAGLVEIAAVAVK